MQLNSFLGVHITEDLTWSAHTDAVLKKAHSSSWDGRGSLERAPESSGPSTPALWRASWPAASPPGLETAPLATAGLCKGSCELPTTLLEVSFPPSRISTPGGVQGKPGGLSKTPAICPTDCSLCCPQGDVSAASDPALADWGTAFSLRLMNSQKWPTLQHTPTLQYAMHCTLTWTLTQFNWTTRTHTTLIQQPICYHWIPSIRIRPMYNLLHLRILLCVCMCT